MKVSSAGLRSGSTPPVASRGGVRTFKADTPDGTTAGLGQPFSSNRSGLARTLDYGGTNKPYECGQQNAACGYHLTTSPLGDAYSANFQNTEVRSGGCHYHQGYSLCEEGSLLSPNTQYPSRMLQRFNEHSPSVPPNFLGPCRPDGCQRSGQNDVSHSTQPTTRQQLLPKVNLANTQGNRLGMPQGNGESTATVPSPYYPTRTRALSPDVHANSSGDRWPPNMKDLRLGAVPARQLACVPLPVVDSDTVPSSSGASSGGGLSKTVSADGVTNLQSLPPTKTALPLFLTSSHLNQTSSTIDAGATTAGDQSSYGTLSYREHSSASVPMHLRWDSLPSARRPPSGTSRLVVPVAGEGTTGSSQPPHDPVNDGSAVMQAPPVCRPPASPPQESLQPSDVAVVGTGWHYLSPRGNGLEEGEVGRVPSGSCVPPGIVSPTTLSPVLGETMITDENSANSKASLLKSPLRPRKPIPRKSSCSSSSSHIDTAETTDLMISPAKPLSLSPLKPEDTLSTDHSSPEKPSATTLEKPEKLRPGALNLNLSAVTKYSQASSATDVTSLEGYVQITHKSNDAESDINKGTTTSTALPSPTDAAEHPTTTIASHLTSTAPSSTVKRTLNPCKVHKEPKSQIGCLVASKDNTYRIESVLQSAIYGGVFSGAQIDSNKQRIRTVALKIMLKELEKKQKGSLQEDILAELKFAKEMRGHKNVLTYDESWEDTECIFIVMPFAEFEDLFEVCKKRKVPFTEREARWLFGQLLDGAHFLHTKRIAFRDHSMENILLFRDAEDGSIYPKITDPGQAVWIQIDSRYRIKGMVADKLFGKSFRPPEVYKKAPYNPIKVDSFCLGWVLFYILTKHQAFDRAVDSDEHWVLIKNKSYKELLRQKNGAHLSSTVCDLIWTLLHPDVSKRFTPKQAINHPWFKGVKCPLDDRTVYGQAGTTSEKLPPHPFVLKKQREQMLKDLENRRTESEKADEEAIKKTDTTTGLSRVDPGKHVQMRTEAAETRIGRSSKQAKGNMNVAFGESVQSQKDSKPFSTSTYRSGGSFGSGAQAFVSRGNSRSWGSQLTTSRHNGGRSLDGGSRRAARSQERTGREVRPETTRIVVSSGVPSNHPTKFLPSATVYAAQPPSTLKNTSRNTYAGPPSPAGELGSSAGPSTTNTTRATYSPPVHTTAAQPSSAQPQSKAVYFSTSGNHPLTSNPAHGSGGQASLLPTGHSSGMTGCQYVSSSAAPSGSSSGVLPPTSSVIVSRQHPDSLRRPNPGTLMLPSTPLK